MDGLGGEDLGGGSDDPGLCAACGSSPTPVGGHLDHDTTAALRQLLEAGVRACSPMEAAEAIVSASARALGLPTGCAYLVDGAGVISEVATVGAAPALADELRARLVGRLAGDSPVWRRTVQGDAPGPDLIPDTAVAGQVRANGVAQVLGLGSLVAIPLLSSDGPLGLVLCGAPEPRRSWAARAREVLGQLALEGTVVVDNARLRQAERHEANHDPLTGLVNRRAFSEQVGHALARAEAEGDLLSVLVVDLDRFKEVNDRFGHACGDELLVEMARRLRAGLRPGDILARLGGDEFAVVLTAEGAGRAEVTASELRRELGRPVRLSADSVRIEASIGAASYPEQGRELTDLLLRADLSMYASKRSQRRRDSRPAPGSSPEPGLLGDLRRALRRDDELVLHYQPKVHLRTGAVVGVEGLVRWMHPTHGLLGADCVVALLEEAGMVPELTAHIVPMALRQLRSSGDGIRMAVNLSADDLADPGSTARMAGWLGDADLPGGLLVVEVTESASLSGQDQTTRTLVDLRALGVEVSIDDFGTGYSSLAYLGTLPLDEIKIDRSFLRADPRQRHILRSVIGLGRDLGLRVVAEGVETAEDAAWLAESGCDLAQGFYFARPMPADALTAWLAERSGSLHPAAGRSGLPAAALIS